MTEVDIWVEVLETIGFKFEDEVSGGYHTGHEDVNCLNYSYYNSNYRLYFNRNTEEVISFYDNGGISGPVFSPKVRIINTNKEKFYNMYLGLFREVKLRNLV